MIVLDASAAVELLLSTPLGAAVRRRIARERGGLAAPHLIDVEVAHVLRRYDALGAIEPAAATRAVAELAMLDVVRYAHVPFLERAWQLRQNATAYDAVYLALAEALDAPLLTTDRRLTRCPGHAARVEVVPA